MKRLFLIFICIPGVWFCTFAQNSIGHGHIGLYTMTVGEIKLTVITDGHLPVNPVQAEFAQRIDSTKVAKTLENHFSSPVEVDLAMNVLLLECGDKRVLIDTGAGGIFGNDSGHLGENLAYAGLSPKDVTDVVLSHAHPDHIGGLTDKRSGELLYPNADVWISKEEYTFWLSDIPDFSKSTMTDKTHMQMLVQVARRNINAAKNRLRMYNDGDTLLGCLQMLVVPGHTPGHSIIKIYSGNEELFHIADIVHSEIISFEHPDWIYNSDTDYKMAIKTRKEILGKMAETKSMFFAYHLPWPGFGYAIRKGKVFVWQPLRIAMPY